MRDIEQYEFEEIAKMRNEWNGYPGGFQEQENNWEKKICQTTVMELNKTELEKYFEGQTSIHEEKSFYTLLPVMLRLIWNSTNQFSGIFQRLLQVETRYRR
jgi:hypothetical protein